MSRTGPMPSTPLRVIAPSKQYFVPKPGRSLIRRRVTLIAAVRCTDGIAIAADTQETVGHYRRAVQKISPFKFGDLSVIVAGSGIASLIESFILKLSRRLSGSSISNLADFVSEVEDELVLFHDLDVRLCPDEDKTVRLFIAAAIPTTREFDVWVSENVRLKRIGVYELIGWDEPVYHNIIQRLCSAGMTLHQGVLAAAYTLVIAKATSNYVGGDTSVAVIRDNGIWMERPEYLRTLEERLNEYDTELSSVFLACADTSVSPSRLQDKLVTFSKKVLALHNLQVKNAVADALGGPQLNLVGDPYPKIPLGLTITLASGDLETDHDCDPREELLKRVRSLHGTTPFDPIKKEGQN